MNKSKTIIGTQKLMKCGLTATIISEPYKKNNCSRFFIRIKFSDGYERECAYTEFNRGSVGNPNIKTLFNKTKNKYLGMTVFQKNENQSATIIKYNNCHDITIEFQDGEQLKISSIVSFKKGTLNRSLIHGAQPITIGKTYKNKFGEKFIVLSYIDAHNVLIKYENGIQKTLQAWAIRTGKNRSSNLVSKNHIGETKIAKNGMKMTIIKYETNQKMTVQFQDGYQRTVSYVQFKRGQVKNPNLPNPQKINVIGYECVSNQGIPMKVINCQNGLKDIDIQFCDGTIINHKSYHDMRRGAIKHPNLTIGKSFCGYTILKTVISKNKNHYYHVINNKTEIETVMSVKEMLQNA